MCGNESDCNALAICLGESGVTAVHVTEAAVVHDGALAAIVCFNKICRLYALLGSRRAAGNGRSLRRGPIDDRGERQNRSV